MGCCILHSPFFVIVHKLKGIFFYNEIYNMRCVLFPVLIE